MCLHTHTHTYIKINPGCSSASRPMTLSNIDFTCPAFSHKAGKNNRFCKTQGHTENLYTLMMNITEMYNQWRKNVKDNLCLHSTRCGEMKDKNKENEWSFVASPQRKRWGHTVGRSKSHRLFNSRDVCCKAFYSLIVCRSVLPPIPFASSLLGLGLNAMQLQYYYLRYCIP